MSVNMQASSVSFPEASKSHSLSSLPKGPGSAAASPIAKNTQGSQLNTHRTEESSNDDAQPPSFFNHLLTFPQEIEPVFEELREEQQERRLLDHVRNREVGRYLDRINDELNVASRERMESDVLLDKLNSTRLDAMQKPLIAQIENGFRVLHEDLDDSKERLRVATEKLYQYEIDAELERQKLHAEIHNKMDAIQNELVLNSDARVNQDVDLRNSIPDPILLVWRGIQDEKDQCEGEQEESRERLLPLEHSDLNDIENSQAQKTIRKELQELCEAILAETADRISEEKRQAARAHALTDALRKGLKIVNRSDPAPEKEPEVEKIDEEGEEDDAA